MVVAMVLFKPLSGGCACISIGLDQMCHFTDRQVVPSSLLDVLIYISQISDTTDWIITDPDGNCNNL